MSDMGLYRTLWLAPVVGTMTAFQVGAEVGQILGKHAPELLKRGMESWHDETAARLLQQDLYLLARESSSKASDTIAGGISELEQLAKC